MHDPIRLYAIDWGTSSARAYALGASGKIVDERSTALGIQRVADGNFAAALATLCEGAVPGVPMLACGMIGSRQGWVEAPYRECPAGFDAIASGLTPVPQTRLAIVPGLDLPRCAGCTRRNARRGNADRSVRSLTMWALVRSSCLPGTHSKWAIVSGQVIEAFATFMTGELFAVLREHSILGRLDRRRRRRVGVRARRRGQPARGCRACARPVLRAHAAAYRGACAGWRRRLPFGFAARRGDRRGAALDGAARGSAMPA